MVYGWKVQDVLCSSDHFPIILKSLQPLHEDRLPHWKIYKTNLHIFETMCKQKLLKYRNIADQTKHFTETLISIANEKQQKTQPKKNTALLVLTMTAEKQLTYLRLPYLI